MKYYTALHYTTETNCERMRNLCFVLLKCLYLSWSDILCWPFIRSNKIEYKETVAFEWILNNEPVENNLTFFYS